MKDLRGVPKHIAEKLQAWMDAIERIGIESVRKQPGYHDEPLKGQRKGQRSIRLSIHYRAIYRLRTDGSIEFVSIEEVTKHAY